MRVLGLIPARGGSKGIPRKNIRQLCGKPLLQYTAEAAQKSEKISRVVLSTEDSEIASIGLSLGLEVPFKRPPELALDSTPTLPVVQHALIKLQEKGDYFDAVCLLQPTNPLRTPTEIDACITLLEESKADTVITVLPVPAEYNPHWVYFQDKGGFLHISTGESNPISRRQELPAAFHRGGSVYVTRTGVILNKNSLYGEKLVGYVLDPSSHVNIDCPTDWERAEKILSSMQQS